MVAERLGRSAVGAEIDEARAAFTASRLEFPTRVIHGSCEEIVPGDWPPFTLVFPSPPYGSFVDGELIDSPDQYMAGAIRIFGRIRGLLALGGVVVVEVGQVRDDAVSRPVVWHIGSALSRLFEFQEDIVRVNTGDTQASPGYNHGHLSSFESSPWNRPRCPTMPGALWVTVTHTSLAPHGLSKPTEP